MVTEPKQLYDSSGGNPALDLVNTVDRTEGQTPPETLVAYSDLVLWSTQGGLLPEARGQELLERAESRPQVAEATLARAWQLREAIFEVFRAILHGDHPPGQALEDLNRELSRALSQARILDTLDGFVWGWRDAPDDLDEPLWPVAHAAGELLVSPQRHHVRQCAADTCLWLFLDATKNHRRRWCDMKLCGNRAKVRRHRKKKGG